MSKKSEGSNAQDSLGVGLDIGTMNIVSAREVEGKTATNHMRDAFLDLELDAKRSLKMSEVEYIEKNGSLVVIGDDALTMANLFKREARRPLSRGVISAGELEAQEILSVLTFEVLDNPRTDDEHCFYSVPSNPIDDPAQDVIFHTEIFRKIVTGHGYAAHPTNEAMAIIFSQCAPEQFSGLAVSFGAGMCNVALAYKASTGMEFALARGGDWVDSQSARAVGKTASQMCAIKERGVDLSKPDGRAQEALALYIRALISYCLKNIAAQFKKVRNDVELPEPIPFIVSGGSSKAGGFLDLFKDEFSQVTGFPIEISEIRAAADPLTAVAEGLLVLAKEEHED